MPTTDTSHNLEQVDTSANGGGCGCGSHTGTGSSTSTKTESSATTATKGNKMTTNTYDVTGMTCGHCASAVTRELKSLDGVSDVTVDLLAGGTSSVTVTSTQPLDQSQVSAALDEAGDYQLA